MDHGRAPDTLDEDHAMDTKIVGAFSKANADLQFNHAMMGSLLHFQNLFPGPKASCLRTLATLHDTSESNIPSLTVVLGVGREFAERFSLHAFFNSMLVFESEQVFLDFATQGYSLVITGGPHHEIVAAASFIVQPDGTFVDALAVSHRRHPGACQLTTSVFVPTNAVESKFLEDIDDGSFQRRGLGSFLLALIARCASLKCDESGVVYLKGPNDLVEYYEKNRYAVVPDNDALPANLFSIVPAQNYHTEPPDTMLMYRRVGRNALAHVSEQAAAVSLTNLKDTPTPHLATRARLKKMPRETSNSARIHQTTSKPKGASAARKKRGKDQAFDRLEVVDSANEDSDEEATTSGYDNFASRKDSITAWTLPERDYWEPQSRRYQQYRSTTPVASHQLTQKEVTAKYNSEPFVALGRLKVIRRATEFRADTKFMQSQEASRTANRRNRHRYDAQFTEQMYLDFAAVSDLFRPIALQKKALEEKDLVAVSVSSYQLPDGMHLAKLLNDGMARSKLRPKVRSINVSFSWLKETCRPDIADWITETLHGTKVQRIGGANVGTDALSLAFSGKIEHDREFVSVPQGHLPKQFSPVGTASLTQQAKQKAVLTTKQRLALRYAPAVANIYYDVHGKATEGLRSLLKKEADRNGVPYAAPPPRCDTQVVKLKWVPSRSHENKEAYGMWRGAFAVRLGTDKSTTVLQECGLLSAWVIEEFAFPLLAECKEIANGRVGKRNPKNFLFIPAGDVHDTKLDPPPQNELVSHVGIAYLQGDDDSCVRHSMASALTAMGFVSEARVVAAVTTLVGCNLALVKETFLLVRNLFAKANLCMKKLHNHACSVAEIASEDALWPILLIIQTSDGSHGTHAVTTWNGMLFDSNCDHALRWSQKSLDWCSGKGSSCIGFSRAFRLCPADYGQTLAQSIISIGRQVTAKDGESSVMGWIMRLPTKKRRKYHVRQTDGITKAMTEEEVAGLMIASTRVDAPYYSV